jgi:hypothetical protein
VNVDAGAMIKQTDKVTAGLQDAKQEVKEKL